MALNYQSASSGVQEVEHWKLDSERVSFKLANSSPKYAIILVMAGDDPKIGGYVVGDLDEIGRGIENSDDISILVLVDYVRSKELKTVVYEYSNKNRFERAELSFGIDTGDPRPIADFLTMAFNSFEPNTRIALGFWGHGDGVAKDHLDTSEFVIPTSLRELPLGTKITRTMFLKEYLSEPEALKPVVYKSMLPDASSGGILTNRELSSALTVAFSRSRRSEPVDMLFFDTCFNGTIEVYAELRRYAKTFVASSILVAGTGWNYAHFLKETQKKLPEDAYQWAKLAVRSWHHAYGRGFSQSPAQLIALNCQSDSLEKLKIVVNLLKSRPCEAQELYSACKLLTGVVGLDESVGISALIKALQEATEDRALKNACSAFLESFETSVIDVSEGVMKIQEQTKLSVWFPRIGDNFKLANYYQNYQFHRETGWFDVVRTFLNPVTNRSAPPIFLIMCFRQTQFIEAETIENFTYYVNQETQRPELLLPISGNQPYIENLQEGRYSFQQAHSSTFAASKDFRDFVDILLSIKRRSGEFSILERATRSLTLAQGVYLKEFFEHLRKYRFIVHDEYPQYTSTYDALMVYAQEAAEGGILIFGTGQRVQS